MSFGENPKPNPIPHEPFVPEAKEPRNSAELTPDEILQILLEVEAKTAKDPEAELTQLEASLLYQVDKDLPEFGVRQDSGVRASVRNLAGYLKDLRGFQDGMSDDEIRGLPDYEQVKSLIRLRLESEKNIVDTSNALQQVMDILGVEGYTPAVYFNTLKGYEDEEGNEVKGKLDEWEERGVFDYLAKELIKNNNRHNIVPVPNAEFDADQIIDLARKFGRQPDGSGQPYETYVADDHYYDTNEKFYHQFTPAELSGKVTEGLIRLSLVPSRLSTDLDGQNVEEMAKTLDMLRTSKPELSFRCPSQLEAIIHWYVLRAGGDKLIGPGTMSKTVITCFDLKPQGFGGDPLVPDSCVDDDGEPYLYDGVATIDKHGRFSVG